MTPERYAELKAKMKALPRVFDGSAPLAASIILTLDKRGSMTLKDVFSIWGEHAERLVAGLVGDASDDLLTTEIPCDFVAHQTPRNARLVLTRAGRRCVEGLEALAHVAVCYDSGRRVDKKMGRVTR